MEYVPYTVCGNPMEVADMAWTIYKYLIAPGSAFEVAVSHRRRKQVQNALGSPHRDMFEHVNKSAVRQLRVHYDEFMRSEAFHRLPDIISHELSKQNINNVQSPRAQQNSSPFAGAMNCFPMFI